MLEQKIFFDDWETRSSEVYYLFKKRFLFNMIVAGALSVIFTILIFFEWKIVVMLLLSVVIVCFEYLHWLKVKNAHLVIKCTQIEITNRFNKTTIYPINKDETTLQLSEHISGRTSVIVMKFYNSDRKMICKYRDLINGVRVNGVGNIFWAAKIESLGMNIKDFYGTVRKNKK